MSWIMHYLHHLSSQQADRHIKHNFIAHQSWVGEGGPRAPEAMNRQDGAKRPWQVWNMYNL